MVVQVQEFNDYTARDYTPRIVDNTQVVEGAPAKRELICPRCDSQLRINYDEPQCLQCGYVDYAYVPPDAHRRKENMMTSGTRYVLRYTGAFENLTDTLTHVQLRRFRNQGDIPRELPVLPCGDDPVIPVRQAPRSPRGTLQVRVGTPNLAHTLEEERLARLEVAL